jgi:hypothetical protein
LSYCSIIASRSIDPANHRVVALRPDGRVSAIRVGRPGNRLSFADGGQIKGPSMSIKFEGKPPFYLGIAEVASAHALDGSVVLRATISVPEMRPKSVPVQFLVATDVAKVLAEQLPIAVRMAELQKLQGR